MSIKKILIPALTLSALYLVACGASDAAIGDSASGGSSGTGASGKSGASGGASSGGSAASSGGACSSVLPCPQVMCKAGESASTPAGECCPVCSPGGAGGSTSSAGASSGGAGGMCNGVAPCPLVVCNPGESASTPAGECCPVCSPGGGGTGGSTTSSGGSGGGEDCSKPHVCPNVLYQCLPGQPETPVGQCCQVCVSAGGSGGA